VARRDARVRDPAPFDEPIYVTRPLLPPLAVYTAALEGVWERRWLTNQGALHDALERALSAHLRVPHLSLVNSGTTALLLAARALELSGEVITTPLTAPATVGALTWCGLTPVFADVHPATLTLDPAAVERAVTPETSAILGVHLYGIPCDVDGLRRIADRRGLHVVYDGAHAFGTEIHGEPVLRFGDATTLSFHATKLFNTAEGGAVVVRDPGLKRRIDLSRNAGIENEVSVVMPGINGKLSELAAALGLANLELVEAERRRRAEIADVYRSCLDGVAGLSCVEMPAHVRNNHQYFVVRIDPRRATISRDDLYERLKAFNVFARRYFYPLCSEMAAYAKLPSSAPERLPVAHGASREVLCLPLYGELGVARAERIAAIIAHLMASWPAERSW
jgi:dTDP-4-amino-4,6-dideoxygalactose transaminase